jgi:hypothetical protein
MNEGIQSERIKCCDRKEDLDGLGMSNFDFLLSPYVESAHQHVSSFTPRTKNVINEELKTVSGYHLGSIHSGITCNADSCGSDSLRKSIRWEIAHADFGCEERGCFFRV